MLQDNDKMPFGKFCGVRMEDVPAEYFFWLWTDGGRHGPVGLHINAGRLEAWTKRRQRRHNAHALAEERSDDSQQRVVGPSGPERKA